MFSLNLQMFHNLTYLKLMALSMSYALTWMPLSFDKTVTIVIACIYGKENYLKPNSDPGTIQMPVVHGSC